MSPHSVPPKQTVVPRLYCVETSQHLRLLKSSASARQQATDSGGGHPSCAQTHTLTNTHSASHTLWAWETWVQREQLDCTVLLTELFLWATCQVGFEGQDECLYCPPGLLSTLPKGNCPLSSLMSMASPYSAAPHTMASWRSKQERQPDSSLLREKQSPLTPLTLLWKPKGWLFCYSSPAQRTNCIRTLV